MVEARVYEATIDYDQHATRAIVRVAIPGPYELIRSVPCELPDEIRAALLDWLGNTPFVITRTHHGSGPHCDCF